MAAAIISQGVLTDTSRTWRTSTGLRIGSEPRWMDYAAIYRTQPAVATAVDLFARNIAQLGLHVFRRIGETDRVRLRDHPLAETLGRPNGWTTTYRLIYSTVADKKIYGESFWVKAQGGRRDPLSLIRIPPQLVDVKGGLEPSSYEIRLYPEPIPVRPDQIVHFRTHNPDNPIRGLSPLEQLRLTLDEDLLSLEHRRDTWKNAGRQPVIIKRPRASGKWDDDVARRFSEHFTEAMRDPSSRTTPILEEDMDLQVLSFNAEQSQYVEGRELTWEEVSRRYHIPLSIIGIAGAPATFASVKEFHKMLYQDTLGPDIAELEADIELQLFPDFPDMAGVYTEFNIFEKMQGTLEEQIDAFIKATGAPIMARDEARSRLNLPSKGGNADLLAMPLNIDPTGEGAAKPAPENVQPDLMPTNGRVNGHVVVLS
jgi:HK97 family phage portal protein